MRKAEQGEGGGASGAGQRGRGAESGAATGEVGGAGEGGLWKGSSPALGGAPHKPSSSAPRSFSLWPVPASSSASTPRYPGRPCGLGALLSLSLGGAQSSLLVRR